MEKMRFSNIHTHSRFSDGKNTLREMAEAGLAADLVSLGFSDHSEVPFEALDFMWEKDYSRYQNEITALRAYFEGKIELLCGLELDSFSREPELAFDYIIGSVHYVKAGDDIFYVDNSVEDQISFTERYGRGDPNEFARRYYDELARMAQRGNFQVLGHFDLINKFGIYDNADETYYRIATEALEEAIKHIPFVEVNTGAISRGYRTTPYPHHRFLRFLAEKGGKVVINGDSHSASALTCHFEESRTLLKECGFATVWQLQGEGWTEVNL